MRASSAWSSGPAPKRLSVSAVRVTKTNEGLTGIGARRRIHASYRLQSMAAVTEGGARRATAATAMVLMTAIRQAIPTVDRTSVLKMGRVLWRCIQGGLRFSIRFFNRRLTLLQSRYLSKNRFGFV